MIRWLCYHILRIGVIEKHRRDGTGPLPGTDALSKAAGRIVDAIRSEGAQSRAAVFEAAPLGGLLDFAEDGLPNRGSILSRSPYFYPNPDLMVSVDGEFPKRCVEFDRREGWVQCEDEAGKPLPRRRGKVEVTVG